MLTHRNRKLGKNCDETVQLQTKPYTYKHKYPHKYLLNRRKYVHLYFYLSNWQISTRVMVGLWSPTKSLWRNRHSTLGWWEPSPGAGTCGHLTILHKHLSFGLANHFKKSFLKIHLEKYRTTYIYIRKFTVALFVTAK